MVIIDADLAKNHIEAGAEVLHMLPVYEEKIKDGKIVGLLPMVSITINMAQHTQLLQAAKNFLSSCTYVPTWTATTITWTRNVPSSLLQRRMISSL